jgi:tyrosyl-tRNA synthetase
MGLPEGDLKMSKSNPRAAIFMEDTEKDVQDKIKEAFCPPKVVEGNPCFDYLKYIIFEAFKTFEVIRKPENGGNKYKIINSLFIKYRIEYTILMLN